MGCITSKIDLELPPAILDENVPKDEKKEDANAGRRREESLRKIFLSTSVLVVIRVRPLSNKEKNEMKSNVCVNVTDKTSMILSEGSKSVTGKKMNFDCCFNMDSSQENVYLGTAKIIKQRIMEGYNGCIFAYGQTGSGKTFTMEGTPQLPGIIPLMLKDMFLHINENKEKKFEVTMTYIEIYQEEIRDLLLENPSNAEKINIREAKDGNIYCDGVVEKTIEDYETAAALIKSGQSRREVGATKMNETSSRSHAILSLSIEQQSVNDGEGYTKKTSKLHLIDLAGSERADSTQATGTRLKEGAMINQSLSALGNVINALTEKDRGHIPYRNSKLTRLLQDSLGGNAYTLMICNVSPASINYEETLSSLRFAERAKRVENHAKINQDPGSRKIAELMEENEKLKNVLKLHLDREKKLENIINDFNLKKKKC